MPPIHVGTSGWVYPHWTGLFYDPKGMQSSTKRLAFLASRFSSVEVNATFYSLARPTTFAKWRSVVPADFVFAIKGSRFITHNLRLGGGVAPLANFFGQGVLGLGHQLGPILWQLPPKLVFDSERAKYFLDSLPRDVRAAEKLARQHDHRLNGRALLEAPDGRDAAIRYAFEVRHDSWMSDAPLRLFEEHNVALVIADTAGVHPFSLEQTANFSYVRLHGSQKLYASRYTDSEIKVWSTRISNWMRTRERAYIYFDNDNKAYAPQDAERLQAKLENREPASWSRETAHDVPDRVDRFLKTPKAAS